MRTTVYLETTIPSYYAGTRPELATDIARTREWWDAERHLYECFASAVVLDELGEGDYPGKQQCLSLVSGLPLLGIRPEVLDIAEVYQANRVMPGPPVRDALHVALATFYRVEVLLTWNCRHIANANKMRHLEVVNARLGYGTPRLITPHMLTMPDER